MITKMASASQRSTVDTCRTLVIWCIFLSLGKEKFHIGQLFGFIILVFGTLVYNEIIEVPIKFLKFYTQRNIELREGGMSSLKKEYIERQMEYGTPGGEVDDEA